MKLLLTSNGFTNTSLQNEFKNLLIKDSKDCKVLFITTAAYGDERDPNWFDKYRQQLQNVGITDIEDLDLRNATEEELEKILATKDIVYVNGGNTFFLLDWVRKSGFDNAIKKFVSEDKVYVGVSAGSIICTPSIESAGWEPDPDTNRVDMTDFTALNFVDFLISPHVDDVSLPMVKESAKASKHKTIMLTDAQAVLVKNGKTEIIGDGEKLVMNISAKE